MLTQPPYVLSFDTLVKSYRNQLLWNLAPSFNSGASVVSGRSSSLYRPYKQQHTFRLCKAAVFICPRKSSSLRNPKDRTETDSFAIVIWATFIAPLPNHRLVGEHSKLSRCYTPGTVWSGATTLQFSTTAQLRSCINKSNLCAVVFFSLLPFLTSFAGPTRWITLMQ